MFWHFGYNLPWHKTWNWGEGLPSCPLEGILSCQPHCGGGSGSTGDRDVSSFGYTLPWHKTWNWNWGEGLPSCPLEVILSCQPQECKFGSCLLQAYVSHHRGKHLKGNKNKTSTGACAAIMKCCWHSCKGDYKLQGSAKTVRARVFTN